MSQVFLLPVFGLLCFLVLNIIMHACTFFKVFSRSVGFFACALLHLLEKVPGVIAFLSYEYLFLSLEAPGLLGFVPPISISVSLSVSLSLLISIN
jgi:hypothetical protein